MARSDAPFLSILSPSHPKALFVCRPFCGLLFTLVVTLLIVMLPQITLVSRTALERCSLCSLKRAETSFSTSTSKAVSRSGFAAPRLITATAPQSRLIRRYSDQVPPIVKRRGATKPNQHPIEPKHISPSKWTDHRLMELLQVDHPLLLAPMAGSGGSKLAIAVARAGGLGSIPCASISAEKVISEVTTFRDAIDAPINLNFFAHTPRKPTAEENQRWLKRLAPYFEEFSIPPPSSSASSGGRAPFDEAMCRLVEDMKPEVVSFHFGLPHENLLKRVRATGAKIIASATTVSEGIWLSKHGIDAVIAQGYEAGGHRGNFLANDMSAQPGLFALLPQLVDAVDIPVIAAGAVADGRGMAAALMLGASGVQVGTAFLLSSESIAAPVHKSALKGAKDDNTALTNVLTGRPARGVINRVMKEIGPLTSDAPPFPLAGGPLGPLKEITEKKGQGDFQPLWSGQSGGMAKEGSAESIALAIIQDAIDHLSRNSE